MVAPLGLVIALMGGVVGECALLTQSRSQAGEQAVERGHHRPQLRRRAHVIHRVG